MILPLTIKKITSLGEGDLTEYLKVYFPGVFRQFSVLIIAAALK